PRWKPCAASNAGSPTSSTGRCSTTPPGRAREGNRDTTLTPARPAHIPTPALRTSHFPDPPPQSLRPHSGRPLDTERSPDPDVLLPRACALAISNDVHVG